MGGRAGKARVTHDNGGVVLLFGAQQVQQGHRVCLSRVTADDEDRFRVMDIVVAVGHGAVAPCVRNTRNGGRVADTCLVIHVVCAPIGGKLAEQIRLLVIVLS